MLVGMAVRLGHKATASGTWVRCLATTATSQTQPLETSTTKVKKNIRITEINSDSAQIRPMVVLLGWLFSKPQHLKKYAELYNQQGFDVVTVQVKLGQLLMPQRSQLMVRTVLDVIHAGDRKLQPLLIHAFSAGGYVFGEMLGAIHGYPDKYGGVAERLYGQLLDSPVDFYGIPHGVSRAITDNTQVSAKIESTIERLLESYMKTFKKGITANYIRSSKYLRQNELRLPSKLVYSLSDTVVHPEDIERVAKQWREQGIDAETECYKNARHVSIYPMYADRYRDSVIKFIARTGIQRHDPSTAATTVVGQSAAAFVA